MPSSIGPSDASPAPREVFLAFQAAVVARDISTALTFYADDALVSQPFAKPASSVLKGRAALVERYGRTPAQPLDLTAADVVIHETADPEVIVVEYDYDAVNRETGKHARFSNVVVMRIRNGLIAESRDYHDHVALAELMSA